MVRLLGGCGVVAGTTTLWVSPSRFRRDNDARCFSYRSLYSPSPQCNTQSCLPRYNFPNIAFSAYLMYGHTVAMWARSVSMWLSPVHLQMGPQTRSNSQLNLWSFD